MIGISDTDGFYSELRRSKRGIIEDLIHHLQKILDGADVACDADDENKAACLMGIAKLLVVAVYKGNWGEARELMRIIGALLVALDTDFEPGVWATIGMAKVVQIAAYEGKWDKVREIERIALLLPPALDVGEWDEVRKLVRITGPLVAALDERKVDEAREQLRKAKQLLDDEFIADYQYKWGFA